MSRPSKRIVARGRLDQPQQQRAPRVDLPQPIRRPGRGSRRARRRRLTPSTARTARAAPAKPAAHREVLDDVARRRAARPVMRRHATLRSSGARMQAALVPARRSAQRRVDARAAASRRERAARREAAARRAARSGSGTLPAIVASRARPRGRAAGSSRAGRACRGAAAGEELADRRASSTIAARIHHRDPVGDLGDDAEVVGDQDDRRCRSSRLQLAQQVEDLRLDRDVERGRRLVGDQQRRARRRAPSRSSRAGACRPRAGADSRRRGARASGMRTRREQLDRALARGLARRRPRWRTQRLGDLVADREAPG